MFYKYAVKSHFSAISQMDAMFGLNSPNPPILKAILSWNVTKVPEATAKFIGETGVHLFVLGLKISQYFVCFLSAPTPPAINM